MKKIKKTLKFLLNHPLGKKHPVQTLFRLLAWQIQASLSPSKFIVRSFIAPVKFYAKKGLTGITGNIYTGLHEFDDMAFLLHFLRPEDTFFDIGANVGSYTLLASGVCGTKSIAIEPAKQTFDILSKNIELNKLGQKVSLVKAVAGSSAGTIIFTENKDTLNHVLRADESKTGTAELPVITIDSLITAGLPALIKIDTEGYETEVLKGMSEILENAALKAIIIELNGSGARYGFDESQIHDLLISKGFTPHGYDPFNRQMILLGSYGNYNTIYCRDMEFVTERIKNAKAIKVMGEMI